MDLKENFLPQDLHKALAETICISNCSFLMQLAIQEDDFKKARRAAENMARSFGELEQMNDKKRHRDGLERLSKDLGVEFAIVRKWS